MYYQAVVKSAQKNIPYSKGISSIIIIEVAEDDSITADNSHIAFQVKRDRYVIRIPTGQAVGRQRVHYEHDLMSEYRWPAGFHRCAHCRIRVASAHAHIRPLQYSTKNSFLDIK